MGTPSLPGRTKRTSGRNRAAGSRHTGQRRRMRQGQRGQALAELAIMLPLLLILVIGVIEVSNAMNAYISVISAARDGARLGSKGAATTPQIQSLVITDMGRLPNTVPTGNVTVTYPTVAGTNSVKVKACYDHTTLLHVPLVMSGTFTMCSETTMPKLN